VYDDISRSKARYSFTLNNYGYDTGILFLVSDLNDVRIIIYESYSDSFYQGADSNGITLYAQKTDVRAVDLVTGKTIYSGSRTFKPPWLYTYFYRKGDTSYTMRDLESREDFARAIARLLLGATPR
jgi:hypothetical protein